MSTNIILSIVSSETFVGCGLLMDDHEFMNLVKQGTDLKQLINYANENY